MPLRTAASRISPLEQFCSSICRISLFKSIHSKMRLPAMKAGLAAGLAADARDKILTLRADSPASP